MISWTYRLSVEERMVGNTANNITKHHNLGKNQVQAYKFQIFKFI